MTRRPLNWAKSVMRASVTPSAKLRAPLAGLAGLRVRPVVRTVDMLPTVLALLHAPPPAGIDGVSLLPGAHDVRVTPASTRTPRRCIRGCARGILPGTRCAGARSS